MITSIIVWGDVTIRFGFWAPIWESKLETCMVLCYYRSFCTHADVNLSEMFRTVVCILIIV